MNQVLEILKAYPECIRPFLTDEPPKPNTTIDALPFQPNVGTCIISESTLTGLAVVDSVSGSGFRTMRSASAAAVPISSYTPSPIPLSLPDANSDKFYGHEKRFSEQANLHGNTLFQPRSTFDWPGNYSSHLCTENLSNSKLASYESYQLPSVDENTHLIGKSSKYSDQCSYASGNTVSCRKQKRSNVFLINTKSIIPDELSSLLSDNQLQSSSDATSGTYTRDSERSCILSSDGGCLDEQFPPVPMKESHIPVDSQESRTPINDQQSRHLNRPTRSLTNVTSLHSDWRCLHNLAYSKHCISAGNINLICTQTGMHTVSSIPSSSLFDPCTHSFFSGNNIT
ncbi:unnamed protein product [Trichobilharzia regenti]|nr:unnamed protein product [Trichobilharzia regenti]